MHYPLTDTCGEILLRVRAQRTHNGYGQRSHGCQPQNGQRVVADSGSDQLVQPSVSAQPAGLENVVEDNLQGPGLKQAGGPFANDRQQSGYEGFTMRTQEIDDG